MATGLRKVADGVHVGPLFARHLFNTVVLEGPEVMSSWTLAYPGPGGDWLASYIAATLSNTWSRTLMETTSDPQHGFATTLAHRWP